MTSHGSNRGQGRGFHPNRMPPSVQLLHGLDPNCEEQWPESSSPRTHLVTKHKTRGNKRDYGLQIRL